MNNLPSNWEAARAPDGKVYYIDHNTKTTTFRKPLIKSKLKLVAEKYLKTKILKMMRYATGSPTNYEFQGAFKFLYFLYKYGSNCASLDITMYCEDSEEDVFRGKLVTYGARTKKALKLLRIKHTKKYFAGLNVKTVENAYKEKNCEVFIIPITAIISRSSLDGHQQLLIINKKNKTLELFDPNGTMSSFCLGQRSSLKELADSLGLTVVNENQQCDLGSQYFESREEGELPSDRGGWCMAWSYLYAELRLRYTDLSSRDIRDVISKTLKEKNVSFKDFIRGDTNFTNTLVLEYENEKYYVKDMKHSNESTELYERFFNLVLNKDPNVKIYSVPIRFIVNPGESRF
jgi:hypothetical protein